MWSADNKARGQRGMTLIELMVVLVIIAIVAAIAYPSYTQYVTRAKRSTAHSVLLQVADRQQQFFMDNKQFATDLTALGFPSNPIIVGSEGRFLAAGDSDRIYEVALAGATPTDYSLTATPQLGQAKADTTCGVLTYDQTGAKGADGSVEDCW